jgi:hypothetical protein
MTLREAKSIARHLGLTLRQVRSGDYRVNFRDGSETTAYYTNGLEDAVTTAVEMARARRLGKGMNGAMAIGQVRSISNTPRGAWGSVRVTCRPGHSRRARPVGAPAPPGCSRSPPPLD